MAVTDFYLTWGNSRVGKLHGMSAPTIKLNKAPNVIQAFRHKEVIIDNRYPAAVYEYPFEVIINGSSIIGFAHTFYGLSWLLTTTTSGPSLPRTLTVATTAGTPLMSYGACYCSDISLKEPDTLILHESGLVGVSFIGSQLPTVP